MNSIINQNDLNKIIKISMNVVSEFENLIKLLVLGDVSVGKSNFLFRFIEDKFLDNHLPTVGFDYKSQIITLPDKSVVKLQIWDTVGEEKFMSINQSLLAKVHGVILIYDITDQTSFEHITNWLKIIREANENASLILVANKCDEEDKRVVSEEEGNKIAEENNISFVEASAKENINVKETFVKIAEEIMLRVTKKGKADDSSRTSSSEMMFRKSFSYKPSNQNGKKFKCCPCLVI